MKKKTNKGLLVLIVLTVLMGLILVNFCRLAFKPAAEVEAAPAPELVDTYIDEELELLALVIYQEAGSDACSDDTRLMVGTVVMNRVADSRFPDTVRGVVLQRAQYGRLYWTGPVWPARASKKEEAHAVARAYKCAELILLGYRALSPDTVFQAEFKQGDEVVAQQDGIYFCRWEVEQ